MSTVQHRAWSVAEIARLVVSEFRKTLATSTWWALLIPGVILAVAAIASEARKNTSRSVWPLSWARRCGRCCSRGFRVGGVPAQYDHHQLSQRGESTEAGRCEDDLCRCGRAIYGVVCAGAAVAAVPLSAPRTAMNGRDSRGQRGRG